MADDPFRVGAEDRIRINVAQKWELAYWKRKFTAMVGRKVESADLKAAVHAVGPMADDVLACLRKSA